MDTLYHSHATHTKDSEWAPGQRETSLKAETLELALSIHAEGEVTKQDMVAKAIALLSKVQSAA